MSQRSFPEAALCPLSKPVISPSLFPPLTTGVPFLLVGQVVKGQAAGIVAPAVLGILFFMGHGCKCYIPHPPVCSGSSQTFSFEHLCAHLHTTCPGCFDEFINGTFLSSGIGHLSVSAWWVVSTDWRWFCVLDGIWHHPTSTSELKP